MVLTKEILSECPITTAQRVLSSKWSLVILFILKDHPVRFNELLRMFDGMNHTTLTKQLRQLEEFGVVHREVYHQVPPKVEYSLTELGHKLEPTLVCLSEWGQEYIRERGKIETIFPDSDQSSVMKRRKRT